MTLAWWNPYYPIRRNINIVNTGIDILEAGSPVYIQLDYIKLQALQKVRDDFEDIEIVYWDQENFTAGNVFGLGSFPIGEPPIGEVSFSIPSNWKVLARTVEYDSINGIVTVIFNTQKDIVTSDLENYFIYMSNATLKSQFPRPVYLSAEFSKIATPANSGIMFTKPTEEWHGGLSIVNNARAAFSFYGKNAKLVLEYGPDRGIVELKTNYDSPILIDTFNPVTVDLLAYTAANLPVGKQYIRLRATGDKNPSSSSDAIKITEVQYSNYILSTLDPEEIYSTSDVTTTLVGI